MKSANLQPRSGRRWKPRHGRAG